MNCEPPQQIDLPLSTSSPYYLGDEIADQFPPRLRQHDFDRCFLVTGRKLWELFGESLFRNLRNSGIRCTPLLIPDSERFKDWRTLRSLCNRLVARKATKDSLLIALGGGMIGNVVGMAAALTYRGIRYVEVPTTIMAQTDSTLSNKQAINGPHGKNHFGVYHAPLFIWADTAYARLEPERQKRSGIVEGIKNVFISQDGPAGIDSLLETWRTEGCSPSLVRLLIESKLAILDRDPTERGSAIVLEYGHTFGHAIEWLASGSLFHGEAVSIGMCLAAELSHALGFLPAEVLRDHKRFLGDELGVPTRLPAAIAPETLYRTMRSDNKRTRRGLRYLLLQGYGRFVNPHGDFMIAVEKDRVIRTLISSQN